MCDSDDVLPLQSCSVSQSTHKIALTNSAITEAPFYTFFVLVCCTTSALLNTITQADDTGDAEILLTGYDMLLYCQLDVNIYIYIYAYVCPMEYIIERGS